jgi:hypothetical protein
MRRAGIDMEDLKAAHAQASQFVGAMAASRAPRQTGMLAASWRPSAAATQATIRFGGARVPYANAVHWGTGARPGKRGPHNIAPNPFVVNTAHDLEPTWVPIYLEAIEAIIDTVRGA